MKVEKKDPPKENEKLKTKIRKVQIENEKLRKNIPWLKNKTEKM